MARSTDWEKLPMAAGDPAPAWLLPGVAPKFAVWSVGGGRPFNCTLETCERWHAGIDLTGAPDGATIVAPEDALVVGIDRGWSEGAKAAFLRTKTGLFLVLGGFKAGSHKEFDIQTAREVRKGEKLGRILGSYGMIHLETYAAEGRATRPWRRSATSLATSPHCGDPPPRPPCGPHRQPSASTRMASGGRRPRTRSSASWPTSRAAPATSAASSPAPERPRQPPAATRSGQPVSSGRL